jgi:hypothetical protein
MPVIPFMWEVKIGGLRSRLVWAKMQDPITKITKAKMLGV